MKDETVKKRMKQVRATKKQELAVKRAKAALRKALRPLNKEYAALYRLADQEALHGKLYDKVINRIASLEDRFGLGGGFII